MFIIIVLLASFGLTSGASFAGRLDALSHSHKSKLAAFDGFPTDPVTIAPKPSFRESLADADQAIGWITATEYEGATSCGGAATFIAGYLTNTCMVSKPSDPSNAVKSYYFTCSDGKDLLFVCL